MIRKSVLYSKFLISAVVVCCPFHNIYSLFWFIGDVLSYHKCDDYEQLFSFNVTAVTCVGISCVITIINTVITITHAVPLILSH